MICGEKFANFKEFLKRLVVKMTFFNNNKSYLLPELYQNKIQQNDTNKHRKEGKKIYIGYREAAEHASLGSPRTTVLISNGRQNEKSVHCQILKRSTA